MQAGNVERYLLGMAAHVPLITIEEYLRTSYMPDVEFLDGHLQEKPMGTWDHGFLQGLLFTWFLQHRLEWNVVPSLEVRTRVSDARVRLPDVVVDRATPHPPVLTEPPLLAIEVLSPTDTYSALRKRARDYQTMGIAHIWLIDPDTRTAQTCEASFWVERERLEVPNTPIYLDVPALFAALDAGAPL